MAAFEKISTVVCSGSQTTISFPTIPATYRDLELIVTGRTTTAATLVTNLRCQFNADTGPNYDWARWNRFGSVGSNADNFIVIGEIAAATAPTDVANSSTVSIPDYRGTTFQKTLELVCATKTGVSSTNDFGPQAIAGFWRNTAAISSILLSLISGNFVDGTVATLYGKG